MPPRKKSTLPEHVRQAAVAGLQLSRQSASRAEEFSERQTEDFHVMVFLTLEQGDFTIRELAEEMDVSNQVISKWRILGKQARDRRLEQDGSAPERSGERVANG